MLVQFIILFIVIGASHQTACFDSCSCGILVSQLFFSSPLNSLFTISTFTSEMSDTYEHFDGMEEEEVQNEEDVIDDEEDEEDPRTPLLMNQLEAVGQSRDGMVFNYSTRSPAPAGAGPLSETFVLVPSTPSEPVNLSGRYDFGYFKAF